MHIQNSLIAATLLLILTACSGGSGDNSQNSVLPPLTQSDDPTSTDNMVFENQQRTLDSGIVKILGENRGHYRFDIQVSDGDFQIGFYTLSGFLYSYWFAQNDTATFTADLYGASSTRFSPGRYQYVDIGSIRNGDETLGQSVFSQAKVIWDFNGDGEAEEDEQLDVVDGTIDVTGTSADTMNITFSVLLVTGQQVTGTYVSTFDVVD